jgi:hypothetical protein
MVEHIPQNSTNIYDARILKIHVIIATVINNKIREQARQIPRFDFSFSSNCIAN